MRVNRDGFKRIRTRMEALVLSDADKAGPFLTVLDDVARKSAMRAIRGRGDGTWAPLNPAYAARKAKGGYGRRMMVMAKEYRGRAAMQLLRGFTLAQAPHIARWVHGLRYQFGIADQVAFFHDMGGTNLPRRSVIDFIYGDYRLFVAAFVKLYRARVRQTLRHT